MDSTPTSPYASTPVQQQQQQQQSRPRRRSSFVRCYNCDQWFSCAQHLMQHKTAEHPMAEAVRKMGLKIVKDRESGSTAAIIPDTEAHTDSASVAPLHHQHQQPQHSRQPVPDLQETEELLDRLKLLSVGQRTKRRQSRQFQQQPQQQEPSPHCRQRRRITLDSPDTATAAAAAAAAAAVAAEAAACQLPAFACQCGALLPDLPLVKQLHMRTNHESPVASLQQQQQQFQQPPAMFSMVQLSPCSPCYSMHHHPSSIFLPAMAYQQQPPPQQSATPSSHLIGYAFQPPLPQLQ